MAVDGNRFKPYGSIPFNTYVKGDGRFANIAAASVLAKTERDVYMTAAAEQYPQYGWADNKGYQLLLTAMLLNFTVRYYSTACRSLARQADGPGLGDSSYSTVPK